MNGTHAAVHKNGAAPKPTANSSSRPRVLPSPDPPPAPFIALEPAAVPAPMWPVHSNVWFQPERAPSPPAWSDLTIERRHRVPAPDFVCSAIPPFDRAAAPAPADGGPLPPDRCLQVPKSELAPIGWDSRAFCPKEEA
jgi:hypothetical protein